MERAGGTREGREMEEGEKKGKKRTKLKEEKTDFNVINYEDFVPVRAAVSLRVTSPHAFNTPKYGWTRGQTRGEDGCEGKERKYGQFYFDELTFPVEPLVV